MQDTAVAVKVSLGARPPLPAGSYISWGLSNDIRQLMNDCWERKPAARPEISKVVSRLVVIQPKDDRPAGSWNLGPAMRCDSTYTTDAPITLDILDEILSRVPPPPTKGSPTHGSASSHLQSRKFVAGLV